MKRTCRTQQRTSSSTPPDRKVKPNHERRAPDVAPAFHVIYSIGIEFIQTDVLSRSNLGTRSRNPIQELLVIKETIFEPIVLISKTYQYGCRLSMTCDKDLITLRFANDPAYVVLRLGHRSSLHSNSPCS